MGGPKEFPKLLCLNVKNSILSELLISFWQNDCLTTPHEWTNFHILEFNSNNATLLGITISKELIKVIPLKMMYYSDFYVLTPTPNPALSRFPQLGLKRKKMVAAPPP